MKDLEEAMPALEEAMKVCSDHLMCIIWCV